MLKERIRALDMRAALEHYGVGFNQQGVAICPFHRETVGSFRVKGRFWHCFGCGDTGDLIKFVRKQYGLSYPDALDAICRDFGIVAVKPTRTDQERLDFLKLERYNIIKRYEELLNTRDICVDVYLLSWDIVNFVAADGGRTIDNDQYVDACFALLRARSLLDDVEFDCAEYLKQHPVATPIPPKTDVTAVNGIRLPPAPKWRDQVSADQF